ncbi:MAG: hypothetical protein IKO80_05200 [Lachnospiraceae bacterium]|nr:hypothetical protein [Lachnospiraceae bacterium]
MINFDEELRKFHPSLELDDAKQAIETRDLEDVADVLVKMLGQTEAERRAARQPAPMPVPIAEPPLQEGEQ